VYGRPAHGGHDFGVPAPEGAGGYAALEPRLDPAADLEDPRVADQAELAQGAERLEHELIELGVRDAELDVADADRAHRLEGILDVGPGAHGLPELLEAVEGDLPL